MRSLVSAIGAAVVSTQPAQAADYLQPTGKWIVDFGDEGCLAQRNYGSAKDPLYLLLKPSPVGGVMQLHVAEKGSTGLAFQEKLQLTFSNGEQLALWQLRYSNDGMQLRLANLSNDQTARLAATTTLLWSGPHKQYRLHLGPMTKLIETVEKCRTSLAGHWNGTPEKQALLKRGPQHLRQLVSLFSTNDYPAEAMRKDQSGTAQVVALIDEKGKLADCSVVETSGIAVLDAQTCIIIRKRGRFSPAIGADGKPAKGVFTQRIRWEMP